MWTPDVIWTAHSNLSILTNWKERHRQTKEEMVLEQANYGILFGSKMMIMIILKICCCWFFLVLYHDSIRPNFLLDDDISIGCLYWASWLGKSLNSFWLWYGYPYVPVFDHPHALCRDVFYFLISCQSIMLDDFPVPCTFKLYFALIVFLAHLCLWHVQNISLFNALLSWYSTVFTAFYINTSLQNCQFCEVQFSLLTSILRLTRCLLYTSRCV